MMPRMTAVEELVFELNQLGELGQTWLPKTLTLMGLLILTEMWRPMNFGHCLLMKQLKSTYHNLLELLKISAVTRMRLLSNPFHQQRRHNRTNNFGVESISTLGTKVWALVSENLRQSTSLYIFKQEIKKWNPSNCPCRRCKIYVQNVGFI